MTTQLDKSIQEITRNGSNVDELLHEVRAKSTIEISSLRQQNMLLSKQVREMQDEMEQRERIYRQKHDKIVRSFQQFKAGGEARA